jgi:hypothetical protein
MVIRSLLRVMVNLVPSQDVESLLLPNSSFLSRYEADKTIP